MHGHQGDRCERQRLRLRRRWRPGLDVPKSPAVCTFLHRRDWQGKTAIPFMTNGGWPGRGRYCRGTPTSVGMKSEKC